MSTDDLYHVTLAGGIQYDVKHDRLISVPATILIDVTDMATYSTGTVWINFDLILLWNTLEGCQQKGNSNKFWENSFSGHFLY